MEQNPTSPSPSCSLPLSKALDSELPGVSMFHCQVKLRQWKRSRMLGVVIIATINPRSQCFDMIAYIKCRILQSWLRPTKYALALKAVLIAFSRSLRSLSILRCVEIQFIYLHFFQKVLVVTPWTWEPACMPRTWIQCCMFVGQTIRT